MNIKGSGGERNRLTWRWQNGRVGEMQAEMVNTSVKWRTIRLEGEILQN